MTTRRILGCLFVALALGGCGDTSDSGDGEATTPELSDEDQASATLNEMLSLAKAGDWGAYVDRFYGEQEKFGSSADRDKLVERFRGKWGAMLLPVLESASKVEPRVEGDKAFFGDPPTQFVLYRGDDGSWTFHL